MLLTILIAQYKPDAAALRRTLASLAMQTSRDFAVVLADDGSEQDYFVESRAYLAAHDIENVATAKQTPNAGTVKNILHGLQEVATRWVLTLAPGDFLYDADTAAWWLERLKQDEPKAAFAGQAYFAPAGGDAPAHPVPGGSPFDRSPYDPARYDAKTVKRNLLLYDDGVSGCGMVYETTLFKSALQRMAGHVRLAEDFAIRLFAVEGVKITRYNRVCVWYEYGSGVSTDAAARQRMLGEWRSMVELLHTLYPRDRIVRLAYAYFFNDRHKSRLVRGLVGRLIVPQNAPFKKAQRDWQPPTSGKPDALQAVYDFAATT